MTAFQKIAPAKPVVIFICGDCGRQHNSPTQAVPKGWALVAMDCSGAPFVRCPDCAASVAQAQHDRMTDYMTTMHPPQVAPPRKLTLDEHAALIFLSEHQHQRTWQIARACGLAITPMLIRVACNMLRRLERYGYVTQGDTPPGGLPSWLITAAGRRAVQP